MRECRVLVALDGGFLIVTRHAVRIPSTVGPCNGCASSVWWIRCFLVEASTVGKMLSCLEYGDCLK